MSLQLYSREYVMIVWDIMKWAWMQIITSDLRSRSWRKMEVCPKVDSYLLFNLVYNSRFMRKIVRKYFCVDETPEILDVSVCGCRLTQSAKAA